MLLHFQTRATQKQLGVEIEAKFQTLMCVNVTWATRRDDVQSSDCWWLSEAETQSAHTPGMIHTWELVQTEAGTGTVLSHCHTQTHPSVHQQCMLCKQWNSWSWVRFNVPPNTVQVGMWWSSNSNSTSFELRTFSTDLTFVECFKRFVVECDFVEKSLFDNWFLMHSKKSTATR